MGLGGGTRSFDTEISIDAPVEAVWKALTDARELQRWFPLQARVKPGLAGTIWLSWGEGLAGESRIEVWEPARRLRLAFDAPGSGPESLEAALSGAGDAGRSALRLTTEYVLDGGTGRTHLRLVHAGFGADASWDDEFDSISRGWAFELGGLKHYLERHRGQDRTVGWVRQKTTVTVEQTWARLTERGGLFDDARPRPFVEGGRYEFTTATAQRFAGEVRLMRPPRQFCGTVSHCNDGLMRLELECWRGRPEVNLWLSAYGVPADAVRAVADGWAALLRRIFAREEDVPGVVVSEGSPPSA